MKVTALIALATASMPADTPEVGAYRVAITAPGDNQPAVAQQDVPLPAPDAVQVSAEFDNIAAGDWVVHATAIDAAGNPFGPVQTAAFNVPPADVQRLVPASVTVTLS